MPEPSSEDLGVEESKCFTPPNNVPTTSASTSTTRLHLGFLELNTRVPDTGTATPSRRRLTESQRLARLAKKRAKYAQRTEGQRLHDAHELRTRRARKQEQANANAAAEAALQAQHEETSRRPDNEARRARQQQQANANAVAEAEAALRALEETTRRAGNHRDNEARRARQQQQANANAATEAEAALRALEETTRRAAANAAAAEAAGVAARTLRTRQLLGSPEDDFGGADAFVRRFAPGPQDSKQHHSI